VENLVSISVPLRVRGRRVLITGHTGFKGAWLSEWLLAAGADVSGIALEPESSDSLFSLLGLSGRMRADIRCDIRDAEALKAAVARVNPDIVFHMAAQALVRRSYREPLLTWQTNVDGTLNLLEAVRALTHPVTVVAVTTDKVYKNREWEFSYREEDELGGHDPYSASKAACELAVSSWRACFGAAQGVTVVTARAGNVIGGGDVCEDRIVPDCFRAWNKGVTVQLRNPGSTRPWQHVLEPLSGYLALAAHAEGGTPQVWECNFGPDSEGSRTVDALVKALAGHGEGRQWTVTGAASEHEARALSLSIDRARHRLGWTPSLSFVETIAWTDAGYAADVAMLPDIVRRQIADFEAKASHSIFAA
jgi:CDP-glucose 4,6-dehydratase